MKLGINVSPVTTSGSNRSFVNLVAPSDLKLRNPTRDVPADQLNERGDVIRLATGEAANLSISVPTAAFRGQTVPIVCRWEGNGAVAAWGGVVRNQKISANALTFDFVPNGFVGANINWTRTDAANPVRNIDCREASVDPNALFDATFLAEMKRYSVVRFMKWQSAVESNRAVTWAQRSRPDSARLRGVDGIPVEYMVQLANQTRTNPWFCMPWNADADYIRRFATYVRDNLDPSLVAYVETSNEVWNSAYKVTAQAIAEGVAEGLHPSDKYTAGTKRYAEKTGEVMDIWAGVFAGKMNRIVRVAATQQGTYSVRQILGFRDTARKIDAISTAPYVGINLTSSVPDLAAWFGATFNPKLDQVLGIAVQTKAEAAKYGLRYIAYEAGQHVLAPNDVATLTAINRSPLMGAAYSRYLSKWQADIGDLMVLFADAGQIGRYGAWGLKEYAGQPLAEAPKAEAVDLFQKSYATK